MKLIIDVPDELLDEAVRLARVEMDDYRRRYDRPGWGWTFWGGTRRFWVRGIKGGLSISLVKAPPATPTANSPSGEAVSAGKEARDGPNTRDDGANAEGESGQP